MSGKPSFWSTHFPTFARWKAVAGSFDQVIHNSELPDELKDAVRSFADRTEWRGKPGKVLIESLVGNFTRQLEQGISAESLAVQWGSTIPLSDFCKLREPTLATIHLFPEYVRNVIFQVVRRARPWRSEQIDMARELIAHFQDVPIKGVWNLPPASRIFVMR